MVHRLSLCSAPRTAATVFPRRLLPQARVNHTLARPYKIQGLVQRTGTLASTLSNAITHPVCKYQIRNLKSHIVLESELDKM